MKFLWFFYLQVNAETVHLNMPQPIVSISSQFTSVFRFHMALYHFRSKIIVRKWDYCVWRSPPPPPQHTHKIYTWGLRRDNRQLHAQFNHSVNLRLWCPSISKSTLSLLRLFWRRANHWMWLSAKPIKCTNKQHWGYRKTSHGSTTTHLLWGICNMYINKKDAQIYVIKFYFLIRCSTCFGIY